MGAKPITRGNAQPVDQCVNEVHLISCFWLTYLDTLPVEAIRYPDLLHAMLAIASLQLANLQGIPSTAAMKHYHLATRRLAKQIKKSTARTHPTTVATWLLLAHFGMVNSDLVNWRGHLSSLAMIFNDIPFDEMTRAILPVQHRRRVEREQQMAQLSKPFMKYPDPSQSIISTSSITPSHQLGDLDVNLLKRLTGLPPSPNGYGRDIGDPAGQLNEASHTTDRDIEKYEQLRDLYWWYKKMDVYQSLAGGLPLQ